MGFNMLPKLIPNWMVLAPEKKLSAILFTQGLVSRSRLSGIQRWGRIRPKSKVEALNASNFWAWRTAVGNDIHTFGFSLVILGGVIRCEQPWDTSKIRSENQLQRLVLSFFAHGSESVTPRLQDVLQRIDLNEPQYFDFSAGGPGWPVANLVHHWTNGHDEKDMPGFS